MPKGYPDGIYGVGPLARMNVADRCGTPRADQELAEFHELQRTAVLSSFHYHHARLSEMLYVSSAWSSCSIIPRFSPSTCARSPAQTLRKVWAVAKHLAARSFTTTRLTSRA